MTPLRSISQIPVLTSGQTSKNLSDKNVENQVKQYQINGIDLSALKDEQLYIETSIKSGENYISRKFDFGQLLRYIEDSLSILNNAIIGDYLTRAQADELYLPLKGGTLVGPLAIEYALDGASQPALRLNATVNNNPAGLRIDNGATIYFNENNETIISKDSIHTPTLTCNVLTCNTLSAKTDFNLVGKLKNADDSIQANVLFKADGNIQTVNLTATDTVQAVNLSAANTTTDELTVNNNLTLSKDLTVNGSTTVKNLTASGNISTSKTITATGDITTTGTVKANTVKVNDNIYMSASAGLVAKTKISELTAQYACWA